MAEVHVQRTVEFPDGIEHTEGRHHLWHGLSARHAYEDRAKRLRAAGAAAVFDRRERIITVTYHRGECTEIETLHFVDVELAEAVGSDGGHTTEVSGSAP